MGGGGLSPADQVVAGVGPVHRDGAALQLIPRRLVCLQVPDQDVSDRSHIVVGRLGFRLASADMNLKNNK